jgi:UDP-N-acetyl-2-amino-2-deoxyglucuronate dehydrogenase
MLSAPLRIGVAGVGHFGRYHALKVAASSRAVLAGVFDPDVGRAQAISQETGAPAVNWMRLLEVSDAVVIAAPADVHHPLAAAALRAGKHVLVEKPIALTLADADAMIAACAQAGVRLGVALQRRTEPEFQRVQAAIAAGELGRIVLGNISMPYLRLQSYYDSADWRGTWALDGGGALMNQGIHLVDLLLWLLGDAAEVRATAATLAHAIEVEDCVTAMLRFASGALGSIVATTAAAPGFPHRVEIYGDRGGVQIEGEQVVRWEAIGREPRTAARTGQEPIAAGAGASPTGIGAIGHTRLLGDFVAAIREGRDPLAPGREGRRSLALVLAVYEAARTRQSVQPG